MMDSASTLTIRNLSAAQGWPTIAVFHISIISSDCPRYVFIYIVYTIYYM